MNKLEENTWMEIQRDKRVVIRIEDKRHKGLREEDNIFHCSHRGKTHAMEERRNEAKSSGEIFQN